MTGVIYVSMCDCLLETSLSAYFPELSDQFHMSMELLLHSAYLITEVIYTGMQEFGAKVFLIPNWMIELNYIYNK